MADICRSHFQTHCKVFILLKCHWNLFRCVAIRISIGASAWRYQVITWSSVNTLRPRQNGRHFPDDIFKCIFLNENEWISIEISLKFIPKGQINNIPSLFQIMAWRRPGDKPLSEAMMVSLLTHICVTRPQWVNPNLLHYMITVFAHKGKELNCRRIYINT